MIRYARIWVVIILLTGFGFVAAWLIHMFSYTLGFDANTYPFRQGLIMEIVFVFVLGVMDIFSGQLIRDWKANRFQIFLNRVDTSSVANNWVLNRANWWISFATIKKRKGHLVVTIPHGWNGGVVSEVKNRLQGAPVLLQRLYPDWRFMEPVDLGSKYRLTAEKVKIRQ
jgi:hypothetical protein